MPQSVINTLNAMAAREGKSIIQTQVHVFDELLYAHSVVVGRIRVDTKDGQDGKAFSEL